ncbi:MAG: glycosyltransferase, partial [Rhodoglobus sp.]
RSRIVETLGLVRSRIAGLPLSAIARDQGEALEVRMVAASALGQRVGSAEAREVLARLASGDGPLADAARLSLIDLEAERHERRRGAGLTVAQLFLHADIDPDLGQAGSGDNGGIATLLVRLGNALIARGAESVHPIDRVITVSRGSVESTLASLDELRAGDAGHAYGRVPLMVEPVQAASAWPLRVTARRGIRRVLRAAGPVDVLHLRMADVGSLAAVDAARELSIPVVFTVAPDPHAVVASMDQAGALTRSNFGSVDEREHFWFRTRLVQRIAANAAHTVLFPRPDLKRDMLSLVSIDITAHPERHTIVPEGIDLEVIDRAVAEASTASPSPARAELTALLEQLPPDRRGLPLIVSVGRFHRVKGMATIVEAWAASDVRDRANLLLIGGNLDEPSEDEQEQLDLIHAVVPAEGRHAAGLLLPGHRANDTVARWVAASRRGIPGLAAANGIYVCGSLKEEFGIALLEAMASGLMVVAPNGGGPATYVEQGVTGYLTSTWHVGKLAEAMTEALDAASAETTDARAELSRRTVAESFTIQAMAGSLADVYAMVHDQELAHHAVPVPAP